MMVAGKATTPESAAPCSEQDNQSDDSTSCGLCGALVDVYRLPGGEWICTDHLAASVSLAASDVWPTMVRYSAEFEDVLMC